MNGRAIAGEVVEICLHLPTQQKILPLLFGEPQLTTLLSLFYSMSKDMSLSALTKHLREKTKMQVKENVLKYHRMSSEKKQNTGAAEEVKEQRDFGVTYVSIIPHNTLSNSSFLFQFALSNKGEKEQSPVEKKQKTGDALEGTATVENSSSSSEKTQNTGAAEEEKEQRDFGETCFINEVIIGFVAPLSSLILLVVVRTRLTFLPTSSWIRLAISKGSQSTQLTVFF